MNFREILNQIDLGKFGVEYVDVRIENVHKTQISYTNGELTSLNEKPSVGAFIRVYELGQWFFLSTTKVNSLELEIKKLVESTKSRKKTEGPFSLPKKIPASHMMKYHVSRFDKIEIEEKVKLVESYLPLFKQIKFSTDSMLAYTDIYKEKFFKSSVGTEFSYDFNQAGFFIRTTLKNNEDIFVDRYMKYATQFNELKNMSKEILEYFEESIPFLTAKTIEPGKYRVVLSPEIVGIFTHESFGHKSEADFMLGDEAATKEWQMGTQIGSDILSIVDSGLHEHTSGYCPIDDEGNLAQKNYLIKKGKLAGRLHSTHTAHVFNESVTGNARAMNFEFEPIVRMTSTYIEKGEDTKEQILHKCEGGLYIDGAKHGTGGSTFTIAPNRAYRIKDGKLDEPVRVAVISGSVFETLKKIEAIGNDFDLKSSAFGGCGKMEQMPLPVADGGPSILVSEMQIS